MAVPVDLVGIALCSQSMNAVRVRTVMRLEGRVPGVRVPFNPANGRLGVGIGTPVESRLKAAVEDYFVHPFCFLV